MRWKNHRSTGFPNNTISFKYPENFIGKKVINQNLNIPNYQLIAVIKKLKENNFIKYIAYCRSFINNQWYIYYNNENNIEEVQNHNDIYDNKNACILIYSKVDN